MLLVAGRLVSVQLLEELKQMAGTCLRRHLARHLCQGMDWRSPGGGLPLMAARLALQELGDQGHWALPAAGPGPQRLPKRPRLVRPPAPPAPAPPADWAEEEFGRAPLGEARLRRRLCLLARDLYARPLAALPQACGTRAKTKAAYRFFDHGRVNLQNVLVFHY
jgi:hypothetical protein